METPVHIEFQGMEPLLLSVLRFAILAYDAGRKTMPSDRFARRNKTPATMVAADLAIAQREPRCISFGHTDKEILLSLSMFRI